MKDISRIDVKQVTRNETSERRYNIYLESGAWSTNFKHKLASGSPVFALDPRTPEFFARALRPGLHYLPLHGTNMCNETVRQVSPQPTRPLRRFVQDEMMDIIATIPATVLDSRFPQNTVAWLTAIILNI